MTDEEFSLVFQPGEDIAFIDEVYARHEKLGDISKVDDAFNSAWRRRVPKKDVMGIHMVLFYELKEKKEYYPNRRDEDAINPNGSRLR